MYIAMTFQHMFVWIQESHIVQDIKEPQKALIAAFTLNTLYIQTYIILRILKKMILLLK